MYLPIKTIKREDLSRNITKNTFIKLMKKLLPMFMIFNELYCVHKKVKEEYKNKIQR